MKGQGVMSTSPRVALTVLGFAFGVATGVAPEASAEPQEQARPATPRGSAAPGYTIGPSDILQIVVWKEPDLSRDVTVRFDGIITVPLLGDVQAAGRTPAAVAESISKGLERFIQAPRVTVGVGQATSARFYVVGQVGKSGDFPLSGRTTVLQGLALAGGFKEFAKTESIVLIRQDQTVIPVNYKRIADGRDASQNVVLGPGDTIVVP